MPNTQHVVAIIAFCSSGGVLGAQAAASCSGPGAAFGVTAYQCASCAVKQGAGLRTQYVFQAEPIVLEASPSSVLRAGDVVVAVNGEPIMTQAGADRFTYPDSGKSVLTVRRGSSRVDLAATVVACRPGYLTVGPPGYDPLVVVDGVIVAGIDQVARDDIATVEVFKGGAVPALYRTDANRPVIAITTKRGATNKHKPVPPVRSDTGPLIIIDGVVMTNAPDTAHLSGNGRRYGFAIGCLPSCSRARGRDGTEYYKFDGYPPVVALTPDGLADRAGIRVGDLVTKIDGKSILGEDGALRFFGNNRKATMDMTVLREGLVLSYTLRAR